MANNKKPKTVGALAPPKNHLFSINVVEKDMRVEYINSMPQEEIRNATSQETRRRRIRAD
jgi:hypothetical protein